jgi:rhamnosyltransferase
MVLGLPNKKSKTKRGIFSLNIFKNKKLKLNVKEEERSKSKYPKKKIVLIGSRGIPAKYGGFETFAEVLATRLSKNYEITVTCEYEKPESRLNEYNGVKLEYFPIKPPKNYFLRMIYENLSDIYFLIKQTRKNDIIYFLGIEVGMFLFIPKLIKRNMKLMVNIDGVMWKRTKFNKLERWLLKINHQFATFFSDIIVADSEAMKNYVKSKFYQKTSYIPYGTDIPEKIPWNNDKLINIKSALRLDHSVKKINTQIVHVGINIPSKIEINNNLKKYQKINPSKYWLVVARLEPENNIHLIVKAFTKTDSKYPLLVIGDFTSNQYKNEIHNIIGDNKNILLLGSIYDNELLNMLRQNCYAYIHGHTVGGTNPSLLEAMSMENIIIAHKNEFNMEVCKKGAVYFSDYKDLILKIKKIEKNPENYQKLKLKALDRIKENYLWDKIIFEYDMLFKNDNNHPKFIENKNSKDISKIVGK